MSKLTKLIKTPGLFFKDAFRKKINFVSDADNANVEFSTGNDLAPIKLMLLSGENVTSGSAHLELWINQFVASGERFLIVVRNAQLYRYVRNVYPTLPAAYAKTSVDMERLVEALPYLKAIFYPSSTGNNIHALRFNQFKHVFIGHGDSDKLSSAHKGLRAYDEIWVAGQAHIDRFHNAGIDIKHITFVKVGRPNLKPVLKKLNTPWCQRLATTSMLYLSTWEGWYEDSNYSSIHYASEFLTLLYKDNGFGINVKLHPNTGIRNTLLASADQKLNQALLSQHVTAQIHGPTVQIDSLLFQANLFICDISAVVTECLAANAPIFVYVPVDKEIKLASSSMPFDSYAYTFSSAEELVAKVRSVLDGNDVLAEKRNQAIDYFMSKKETLSGEFQLQLKTIAKT